ncbi:hypothetical protein BCR43DRAFT_492299, partial [Syncephalastrum racemosum]
MGETPFEAERASLLNQTAQQLEQLTTNLGHLNRNLETMSTIGGQYKPAASHWTNFHNSISPSSNKVSDNKDDNKKDANGN